MIGNILKSISLVFVIIVVTIFSKIISPISANILSSCSNTPSHLSSRSSTPLTSTPISLTPSTSANSSPKMSRSSRSSSRSSSPKSSRSSSPIKLENNFLQDHHSSTTDISTSNINNLLKSGVRFCELKPSERYSLLLQNQSFSPNCCGGEEMNFFQEL